MSPSPLVVFGVSAALACCLLLFGASHWAFEKRTRMQRVRTATGKRQGRIVTSKGLKAAKNTQLQQGALAFMKLSTGRLSIMKGRQIKETKRLLVSGVDPDVRPVELAVQFKIDRKLMACCIDLGWQAVDTRSNADETAKWVNRHRFKSVRLVTTDWHMRRAEYELARAVGDKVTIVPDAVHSEPSFATLFREYHKYLAGRAGGLLGL